jgi:hypothetical protein
VSNALVAAGYTPLTILVVLAFWSSSDHSWIDVVQWTSLYLTGIVLPYIWARRALAYLDRLGPAARSLADAIGFYIVASGALTLLVALGLVWTR